MKERCEDCKGLEEEIYWKHFQSMQFCQFLNGDFHSQLVIPGKFSQKLGESLRQKLGLRGPSGTTWDVELMEIGDELCLGNGWGKFVEAHSLAEKDILIFKYTGNSQFDVLMFEGSNLCEKESSYFVRRCGHTKKTEDGSNTPRTALKEISVEKSVLGEKGKSMRKACDDEEQEFSPNPSQVWEPVQIQEDTNEKTTGFKQMPMSSGVNDMIRGYDDELEVAGVEDESVKLPPGSNQTTMGEGTSTPCHLSYASNQRPGVKLPGSKQISVREGKSARYQNSQFSDMKNASDDEPEFAGAEDEFGQHPSRVWEGVKLPGSNRTPEFAGAEDEFSRNPSQVWEPVKLPGSKQTPMGEGTSTPYHLTYGSNRRPATAAVILPHFSQIVMRKGKSKTYHNSHVNASDDEPEFAGAEDELSQNPSQVWEPVKLPGSKQTPIYASNRRRVTGAQKAAAMRLASKEVSESEGSFLVQMRSTHISKRFYMGIPADWAMANGVQVRQDVILRTKEGSWRTRLIFSATGRGGLSRGWKDFALDNRLEELDVCVFKLANRNQKPVVLDVSIFRVVPEVAPRTPLTIEPPSTSQGAPAVNKRKFSHLENEAHHYAL